MPVLKLVCLLVVVLLLATPAHQLGEKEWKKLVSALFTGAKLSDGNGGLLIQGELLEILANHTNDWQIKKRINRYPSTVHCDAYAVALWLVPPDLPSLSACFLESIVYHTEFLVVNRTNFHLPIDFQQQFSFIGCLRNLSFLPGTQSGFPSLLFNTALSLVRVYIRKARAMSDVRI